MDEIFNYLANIFILNGFSLFMIGSSSRDYLLNKEISDYDFCPADKEILERIIEGFNRGED